MLAVLLAPPLHLEGAGVDTIAGAPGAGCGLIRMLMPGLATMAFLSCRDVGEIDGVMARRGEGNAAGASLGGSVMVLAGAGVAAGAGGRT